MTRAVALFALAAGLWAGAVAVITWMVRGARDAMVGDFGGYA